MKSYNKAFLKQNTQKIHKKRLKAVRATSFLSFITTVFARPFIVVVAAALLFPNLLATISTFASATPYYGAMNGESTLYYDAPTFNFDGLYAVAQKNVELHETDGVYKISDYSKNIDLWISKTALGNSERHYIEDHSKIYDESGVELTEYSPDYFTSHGSSATSNFDRITINLDVHGKYTDHEIFVYNTETIVQSNYESYQKGDTLLASFTLRFAYTDYNPTKIPSCRIVDVFQAGERLSADGDAYSAFIEYDNSKDLDVTYEFANLLPGMKFEFYSNNKKTIIDTDSIQTIHFNAGIGSQSPNIIGGNVFRRDNFSTYDGYKNIYFQSSLGSAADANFQILTINKNTGELLTDYIINPNTYDMEANPLALKIAGTNYDPDTVYDVKVTMRDEDTTTYQVNGMDLNAGYILPVDLPIISFNFQDLMDGSLIDDDYVAEINIGYTTRQASHVLSYDARVSADIYTNAGIPLDNFASAGAVGDSGYIRGTMKSVMVQNQVIADEMYLAFGLLPGAISSLDYYLFVSDDYNNDFSSKTLISQGIVSSGSPVILRAEQFIRPDSQTYFSIVTVLNDEIISIEHRGVTTFNAPGTFEPVFYNLSSPDHEVFMTGYRRATVAQNTSLDVKLAATSSIDPNKTYHYNVSGGAEIEGDVLGSALDGQTTTFVIPGSDSHSATYIVKLLDGDSVITSFTIPVAYSDPSGESSASYRAINEIMRSIHDRIASADIPTGTFDVVLSAPDTFENEFDVYVEVGNYNGILGSCIGICGLVGTIEYDSSKLELLSVDTENDFEKEYGDKLVLYRSTGASIGTKVAKLHFRNLSMSAPENTTIKLSNIVGSDGQLDIPASDVSVSIMHDIPYRHVSSNIFTGDSHQIFSNMGSDGQDRSEGYYSLSRDYLSNGNSLTLYYDGFGFDDDVTYNYSLMETISNQLVASGEISGADLNSGVLNAHIDDFGNAEKLKYIMTLSHHGETIFTRMDSIGVSSTHDIVLNASYGFNEPTIVNGYKTVPYDNAIQIKASATGLDDSKTYRLEYSFSDYAKCHESHIENIYIKQCLGDDTTMSDSVSILMTGAEIASGKSIELPTPSSSTIERHFEISVVDLSANNETASPIRIVFNRVEVFKFVKATDIVSSFGNLTASKNMVLAKIAPTTTLSAVVNNLTLEGAYQVAAKDKNGNTIAEEGRIGTGTKVSIMDAAGQTVVEYIVKIKGDISGDGDISILDLVQAKRSLAGLNAIEGIFAEAGDITGTGTIGITDIVKICRHIAKLEEIRQ